MFALQFVKPRQEQSRVGAGGRSFLRSAPAGTGASRSRRVGSVFDHSWPGPVEFHCQRCQARAGVPKSRCEVIFRPPVDIQGPKAHGGAGASRSKLGRGWSKFRTVRLRSEHTRARAKLCLIGLAGADRISGPHGSVKCRCDRSFDRARAEVHGCTSQPRASVNSFADQSKARPLPGGGPHELAEAAGIGVQ